MQLINVSTIINKKGDLVVVNRNGKLIIVEDTPQKKTKKGTTEPVAPLFSFVDRKNASATWSCTHAFCICCLI